MIDNHFWERFNIGNDPPSRIWAGIRLKENPWSPFMVVVQEIRNRLGRGSSEFANAFSYLCQFLTWGHILVVLHHCLVPLQAVCHESQYSETGHGKTQPQTSIADCCRTCSRTLEKSIELRISVWRKTPWGHFCRSSYLSDSRDYLTSEGRAPTCVLRKSGADSIIAPGPTAKMTATKENDERQTIETFW